MKILILGSGLMGPAAAFNALVGAQLGYSFMCRPPGTAPREQFIELFAATAGIHLAGMFFPPLRAIMRLPPLPAPIELAAFGAGLIVPYTRSNSGRDIVFVIDVSRSMLAPDLAPNRLERAKLWVGDLVESREGDRIGLVAFAGAAVVRCPLTLDRTFFSPSMR